MQNKFGAGIIGVHQYPKSTGLFTVIPTKIIQLEEGFYPFTFNAGLYTNFNPSITINKHERVSYDEFEKLVGSTCKGMSIPGLMTSPIWGFKELESLF